MTLLTVPEKRFEALKSERKRVRDLVSAFLGRALLHGVPGVAFAESVARGAWALDAAQVELLADDLAPTAHPFVPSLVAGLRAAAAVLRESDAVSTCVSDERWAAQIDAVRRGAKRVRVLFDATPSERVAHRV